MTVTLLLVVVMMFVMMQAIVTGITSWGEWAGKSTGG